MPPPVDTDAVARDENATSLKRLGWLLMPYLWKMVGVSLLLVALTGVNMAMPAFMGVLFNDVFPNQNWHLLWLMLFGVMVIFVARNALYFTSKYIAVSIGEDVSFHLRNRLFERLQHMNMQFYRQNAPGKLSSRVMNDTFVIQSFIQDELPTLLQSIFLFLGLVAVIYAVNWELALASTIVMPLHLMTFHYFKTPIKQSSRSAQEQLDVVQGNLIEKFLGAEVVKGFTAEQRESEAFVEAIDLSRQSQMRSKTYHVTQKVIADLLVGAGTVGLLGFGAYQVMKPNGMQAGTFLAFFTYVKMLYPTVLDLISGFAKLTKSTASIDRVSEMLAINQVEQTVARPVRTAIKGRIQFKSVSFRYEEGPPVLKNINLEIPAGEACAIIGPSGAGKSTLVSMAPRFLEPNMGRVLIDGVDVREYDLRHLRSGIGISFQECFMFNSSIFENLRYAQPNATMNQIVECAKRTGAHDFIMKLDHGYATRLGEDGVTLSRGEMQRIALTRAMLKSPRILILDEATASIDKESEAKIVPAILSFMRGKTTLMITHNPELLKHASIVVQVVDGCVVYQGPPSGLPQQLDVRANGETMADPKPESGSSGMWRSLPTLLLAASMLGVLLGITPSAAYAQDAKPAATPQPEPPAQVDTAATPEKPAAAPNPKPAEEKPAQKPASTKPAAEKPASPPAAKPNAAAEPKPAPQAAPQPAKPEKPRVPTAPPGEFLALPNVGMIEANELVDVMLSAAQAQLGYTPTSDALAGQLPSAPQGLSRLTTMAKSDKNGMRLIQIGYRTYRTQPPHLWLVGAIVADNKIDANDDLPKLKTILEEQQKAIATQNDNLQPSDLESRKITLSYTSVDRCLQMLQLYGYSIGKAGTPVDPKKLPMIVAMPATSEHNLPKSADANFPATEADPIADVLVFFHPAHPEQYSSVLDKIRSVIDVPDRQILIEAMVLEISETGLERLGVQWELESPTHKISDLRFGRLPTFTTATNEEPTLDVTVQNIFGEFSAQVQALIRDGSAQILSRPSVLTLSNRMAYISINDQIPVVSSITSGRNDTVLVDFKDPIVAGITLNVRPRANADGEEVALQVVAKISSRVPNADVIVRNSDGDEVARSPTISNREVRTYSVIANNTPFIIGGLIAKDDTTDRDKVPLLGDIPMLGDVLFSTKRESTSRREVIIVLTPYVLPEDQVVGRNMPKDEDAFDSFGQKLFRDAYRIRADDVYDLTFLLENQYLQEYKRLANLVVRHNFRAGEVYPFNRFVGRRFPGERILVYRQVYEVIKRLMLDEKISEDKLIFFEKNENTTAGFRVRFLWDYLCKEAGIPAEQAENPDAVFAKLKGKAIAMTYTLQMNSGVDNVLSQPVPDVSVVDCPDSATWDRLLWELNQPDASGRQRYSILVRSASDLVRLKRAIMVKRTVQLNTTEEGLTLHNFAVGRLLLMPTVKRDKTYLIDEETAKYFFYTEQYYPALQKELTRDLQMLNNALRMPEYSRYLDESVPQNEPSVPYIDLSPLQGQSLLDQAAAPVETAVK